MEERIFENEKHLDMSTPGCHASPYTSAHARDSTYKKRSPHCSCCVRVQGTYNERPASLHLQTYKLYYISPCNEQSLFHEIPASGLETARVFIGTHFHIRSATLLLLH